MPIIFRSPLSSTVANDTFLDKTIDQDKKGVLGLYKTLVSDPDAIGDVQDYINELATIDGVSGESDPNSTTYSSEEIIANGDDRKVAIGKLDAQVKTNLDDIADHEIRITNNTRLVSAVLSVADTGQITINENSGVQIYKVQGDAAPSTASSLPFGNSTNSPDGSEIIIIGQDNTNTLTFESNDNDYGMLLNGDAELGLGSMLTLIYDDTLLRYIEKSRNF